MYTPHDTPADAVPDPAPRDPHSTPADAAAGVPLAAEPTRRFCTACGAAWDPAWADCGSCRPSPAAGAVAAGGDVGGVSVTAAVWLYFALLTASLVGLIVGMNADDDGGGPYLDIMVSAAHTLIVAAWVAAAWRQVWPAVATPGGLVWYPVAAGLAVVTFGVATLVISAAKLLPGITELKYAQPFLDAGFGWGTIVLLFCVQPAVVEELAFRGVILGGLRRGLTDGEALLVSAMLFAVLHLSFVSLPHLVLIGGLLGWLRLKTGSLWPGVLLHFAHNALCLWGEAPVA